MVPSGTMGCPDHQSTTMLLDWCSFTADITTHQFSEYSPWSLSHGRCETGLWLLVFMSEFFLETLLLLQCLPRVFPYFEPWALMLFLWGLSVFLLFFMSIKIVPNINRYWLKPGRHSLNSIPQQLEELLLTSVNHFKGAKPHWKKQTYKSKTMYCNLNVRHYRRIMQYWPIH